MTTPNLALPEIAVGQSQKEVTHNDGINRIEDAITEVIGFTITNTNALTITNDQFRQNVLFDLNPDGGTPPDAQITVTVPALERGIFVVKNDTLQSALVTISGQGEAAPVVSAGQVAILATTGVNVRGIEAGVASFLALIDVIPASYAGQAGKSAVVNGAETGLEFQAGGASATNLQTLKKSFQGALVERTSNISTTSGTDLQIPWQAISSQSVFSRDNNATQQRFWLGQDLNFTVNAGNDQGTATAHGMATGDGPFRLTTTTTLPAGLNLATNYWAIRVDDNTIQFATTRANALAGTQVDITDTGTGTHTLDRATRLVIPEGVTKVQLVAGSRYASNADLDGARFLSFQKNESFAFDGRAESSVSPITAVDPSTLNVKSPVLEVTLGDFFEVNVFQNSGSSIDIEFGAFTFFAIQVIESDIILPFPQVIVEKPMRGALLQLDADKAAPAAVTGIVWDSATYDTGFNGAAFAEFVTNPSRITIPAGVRKVRLSGSISAVSGFAGVGNQFALIIAKNGVSAYPGTGIQDLEPQNANPDVNAHTAVLEVTAGDYFELFYASADVTWTMESERTWLAIEVIETDEVLTFPGVTVERPQIGALIHLTSNEAISAVTNTAVPWDAATYDTGYKGTNFAEFVTNPSRFTIPAGITKVRLTAQVFSDDAGNNAATDRLVWITKNGVGNAGSPVLLAPAGLPFWRVDIASNNDQVNLSSATIEVVEGDYFELLVHFSSAVDLGTVSGSKSTWFAIEVVETTDAAFPPEEVETFINGTPAVSDMIYQKVASRRFSFNDELTSSQAYAVTAPSGGAVAFDVQRNAVSVGTITFADTSNTATFTTGGGSQVDFDPGDRLSIHSPANLQSMADIAFNLFCFRT